MEKYTPNLTKYLSEHPEIDRMVKTDSKQYYVFPFIRGHEMNLTYTGPVLRKDWLDDLGLEVPTTIDEWYNVLKAFKERKNAEAPLSFVLGNVFEYGTFVGAYGVKKDFYIEDGVIKYGPIQPEYKDFLATMAKWYNEKLLDPNFAFVDGKTLDSNILSGKTGATVGLAGGGIGKWLTAAKETDSKFDLVGAPYPVLTKGEKPKFGQKDLPYYPYGSAAITSSCKHPELAAKYLDYGYGEEGHMTYNFGIEGESYTMVDGQPKYTEIITNNPEKLSTNYALSIYVRGNQNGPFVQAKECVEQNFSMQQQKDAVQTWMNTDADKYQIPRITPSAEESSEMNRIITDLNTFVSEWTTQVIMGVKPLSDFDDFVAMLKQIGIERAIEIQQNALQRYNSR